MNTDTLIHSLVETYKTLNFQFRNATSTPAAMAVMARMRDDEIAFSQALKDHLTGVGTAGGRKNQVVEGGNESLSQIISQFGTARATTLNSLRTIQDEASWSKLSDDGVSIREHVQNLVANDSVQISKLTELIVNT